MMMMMHGRPLPLNKPSLFVHFNSDDFMPLSLTTPSHPTLPYNFEPKLCKRSTTFPFLIKKTLTLLLFNSFLHFMHLIPLKHKLIDP